MRIVTGLIGLLHERGLQIVTLTEEVISLRKVVKHAPCYEQSSVNELIGLLRTLESQIDTLTEEVLYLRKVAKRTEWAVWGDEEQTRRPCSASGGAVYASRARRPSCKPPIRRSSAPPCRASVASSTSAASAAIGASATSVSHRVDEPRTLVVRTPLRIKQFAGIYDLVPGSRPNGYPCWEQRHGQHCISGGTQGDIIIGGYKEEGRITSCTSHGGLMPHEYDLGWILYYGEERQEADGIEILFAVQAGTNNNSTSSTTPWNSEI